MQSDKEDTLALPAAPGCGHPPRFIRAADGGLDHDLIDVLADDRVSNRAYPQPVPSALKALIAIAKTETQAALRRVRHEPLPANCCQLLAWIARFAPDRDVGAIAEEALAAAAEVTAPCWTVASAAWALRALVERG